MSVFLCLDSSDPSFEISKPLLRNSVSPGPWIVGRSVVRALRAASRCAYVITNPQGLMCMRGQA
ncbi:hypothetical protein EMPG_14658, partial [Blastomyces silverae]